MLKYFKDRREFARLISPIRKRYYTLLARFGYGPKAAQKKQRRESKLWKEVTGKSKTEIMEQVSKEMG